jgi:AcrR family transcriptional regulator
MKNVGFKKQSGGKGMNQESQRVTETKERIRNAFFDLYGEKKIDRISIKEITDRAQLNRGTFYVYYKDIYDLLEKTEDELIAELVIKLRDLIPRIIREENINPFLPPLEFYQRYSKFLKILLGANGDPNFIHKIKTILKKTIRELLQKEQIPEIENLEYVMEFLSSGMIGIISHWLANDMGLSIEVLGEMIKKIMNHGPLGFIKMQLEAEESKPAQ